MFLNNLYGGMDEPEIKIIDVFMCKLRKKLAKASNGKDYIETVRGQGYVLREPNEEATISVRSKIGNLSQWNMGQWASCAALKGTYVA
jgi:DNA-binding winged helix-turn-helix (wHTH) protein